MIMGEVEMLHGERFDRFWPAIDRELSNIPHTWAPWWTKESIYENTQRGRFQCWASGSDGEIRVIAFSQVAFYPANKVFQVFLAFGNGIDEAIPNLTATFEKFMTVAECTMIEVTGRPGWEPKLRKLGFKRVSSTLAMRFEPRKVTVN